MLATDIAYLNHGVGDHIAIHANSSMSEDTSTYKKEYDALNQREKPWVSSAGDVWGSAFLEDVIIGCIYINMRENNF